jgi:hypothetical protein
MPFYQSIPSRWFLEQESLMLDTAELATFLQHSLHSHTTAKTEVTTGEKDNECNRGGGFPLNTRHTKSELGATATSGRVKS